jgi:hypothetical protein
LKWRKKLINRTDCDGIYKNRDVLQKGKRIIQRQESWRGRRREGARERACVNGGVKVIRKAGKSKK